MQQLNRSDWHTKSNGECLYAPVSQKGLTTSCLCWYYFYTEDESKQLYMCVTWKNIPKSNVYPKYSNIKFSATY